MQMSGVDLVKESYLARTMRVGGMLEDVDQLAREIRVLQTAQLLTRQLGFPDFIKLQLTLKSDL